MRPHRAPRPTGPVTPTAAPSFSVITPAYQAAGTIAEAVASALAQTAPALEVVVCDDGSTDDLAGALAPFRDSIELVRKPNGGGASALNAAARAASGDFVAVLDADDVYLPDRIAALSELGAERPDLDLLTTDAWFEHDGRRSGRFNQANPFATRDQRSAILERCFVAWPAIRRSRLLAVGGYDEALRIGYDWDLYIRLLLSGSAVGQVDEPLMAYRLTAGSLASDRGASLRERLIVLDKAARDPSLTPRERAVLKRSLAGQRRRALLAAANASAAAGSPDTRRRGLELALAPSMPLRTRAAGVAAAAAPARARARMSRRGGGSGRSPLEGRTLAQVEDAPPEFLVPAPPEEPPPAGSRPVTFSVVIPAYQAANTVAAAIESALTQTEPPHEVIVSDDGSTDGLEAALAPFGDSIVFVPCATNGGEAAAKNRGARAATGEWVIILDADDLYLPARLERLGQLARLRPDLDILTSDAYLTLGEEVVRRCYDAGWSFEVADQRRGILERNFIFGLAAVRRERFLAAGGFDEAIRWTTDWDLWARLILDGARAGCVDEPLAHYRLGPASLSAQRARMAEGRLMTLSKAARHPTLSDAERRVVVASIARQRRLLAVLRARAALLEGDQVRRRSFAVALGRGFPARTRIKALGAAALPGLARRRLRDRQGGSWMAAGGTFVDGGPSGGASSDPAAAGR
jgi:glycosyltransferase involved in cell wall biosynthesis